MIPQIDWTNVKAVLLAVAFALIGLLAWAALTHKGPIETVSIGVTNDTVAWIAKPEAPYTIKDPGTVHIAKGQLEKLDRGPIVIVPAPPSGVAWDTPTISIDGAPREK